MQVLRIILTCFIGLKILFYTLIMGVGYVGADKIGKSILKTLLAIILIEIFTLVSIWLI